MNNILLFCFIVLTTLLLTELIRRYSLKNNHFDIPNDRSSHVSPTPRGGGISIVFIFLLVIVFSNRLESKYIWAIFGSGLLVAVVGYLDDKADIAARWRLLFHFVAAFWALYFLDDIPEFQFLQYTFNLGWVGFVISAISLVWMLNLFNFMDGIDGIAASETIFVAGASACFSWMNGLEGLSYISLFLASSTMGFLILNWPPAKIFMGDVGSGFLGLMLGIIAYANIIKGGSVWIWLILLAVFLVDSGVTLLRRIINGEKWYEAHCSHAYQHAAKKWGHKRVTISVILINLLWLLPSAYLAYFMPDIALVLTLLTFTPLIIVALKFKAGISSS